MHVGGTEVFSWNGLIVRIKFQFKLMCRYSKEGRAGWDPAVGQVETKAPLNVNREPVNRVKMYYVQFKVILPHAGQQRGEETECMDC